MDALHYWYTLLPLFSRIKQDKVLFNKVENLLCATGARLDPLDASVWCYRCKTINVPVLTCRVRLSGRELWVECKQCLSSHCVDITDKRKRKQIWVNKNTTLDEFLDGI
ncbi:hypothetical protein NEHOM01_0781 [Nematocida homosporus]|uniref:uncharacterized protein n=1 Tax=Nematocida homosporus TaxID=1912981 RepID=UPI00222058C9|nr:uncharacterized protein NEHOM01_0781 [Nematocida homosporus]KAI5185366.1 hypothetical protein NEHOM01_0781 [Nematocida homosporus]